MISAILITEKKLLLNTYKVYIDDIVLKNSDYLKYYLDVLNNI